MVNVVLNRYKNLRHIGCLHSAGKGRVIMEYTFTAANFEEEVLRGDLPVLVDFWATWCGPCRMLAPVIAEIAEAHEGVLKVGKVNVDEQPELATAYRVESIPTVFLFRNGEIAAKAVGFRSRADLESLLGL